MFRVRVPFEVQTEARWVLSFVSKDIFDLDFELVPSAMPGYCIFRDDKQLDMPDCFFSGTPPDSLRAKSLPTIPLSYWDVASSGLHAPRLTDTLPILFGTKGVVFSSNSLCCNVDIIGSIFLLLSRYEELVVPDRDKHGRFPARASLAHQAGYLYRPIADEYVELLLACMRNLWPQLNVKSSAGQLRVTCDVDQPFDFGAGNLGGLVRSVGGDIIKRRDIKLAGRRVLNLISSQWGNYIYDPYYSFEWYMDTCERLGHKASFYFISDNTAGEIDGAYRLEQPRLLSLLNMIAVRGHEIGMHGSYNTWRNATQIIKERDRIVAACESVQYRSVVEGNRQHYLRWDASETPDHLDAAGFKYDSTGAFADAPGFRYGTARSFAMWSWQKMAPLRLKQRPLILMEVSVFSKQYLNLSYSIETVDFMLMLKRQALRFGGDFTMLWHNTNVINIKDKEYFMELIK